MSLSVESGIQNEKVLVLDIAPLFVVGSAFSGSDLPASKSNILIHEKVVESCMDEVTPLPFRFGIVAAEQKIRDFVRTNQAALKADLDKVQGCVEMGLKIMLPGRLTESVATGTEFLNAKRRIQQLQQEIADRVLRSVAGLVQQTDSGMMQGPGATIVRVAHLVRRGHLDEYKSHIESVVRERTEYRFLRSGPWPPYSFVSASRVG